MRNRTSSVSLLLTVTPALPRIPELCTNMQLWITHHHVKRYTHVILAQCLCTLPGLHLHSHNIPNLYFPMFCEQNIRFIYIILFSVYLGYCECLEIDCERFLKTYIPNHNDIMHFIMSCITRTAVKPLQNKPMKRNTSTTALSNRMIK